MWGLIKRWLRVKLNDMHQYIGLFLLFLVIAAGIYAFSHTGDIAKLKYPFPVSVRPAPRGNFFGVPEKNKAREDTLRESAASTSFYEPYFSSSPKARIASLQFPDSFRPYIELILNVDLAQGEKLDITGWTIRSKNGSFAIPRAQKVYSFGGVESDIVLNSFDKVYLYSGRGLKGNFQLNKCTGYLEDSSPFTPSVPRGCAYISRSDVETFSGPCQQYALSLNSCEIPSANPPVPIEDLACREFLRNLNYVGCVVKHRNDSDFFDDEWRVWMDNQMDIFDPAYDRIQLLDLKGNIVDEYVY